MRLTALLTVFAVVASELVAVAAFAADYRLKIGDILELSIAGVDLQRRMTVDVDGKISVPLAGEMHASGSTVAEIVSRLRSILPTKSYNIRNSEGRDNVTVIAPEEISLVIAEYTSVYLNGDVARPGAQAFRPGLTARQAIALAGGYDVLRFRVDNPTLGGIDLQDSYRGAWLDLERGYVRLGLLEADLKRPAARKKLAFPNPIPAAVRSEIAETERARSKSRTEAYLGQRSSLEKAVASDDANVQVLATQKKTEEDSYKFDAEESDRVADLFRKGTVPVTRMSEARRLTLLSATRVLQVAAQYEAAVRQRLTTLRDIQRLDDERKIDLMTALQDTEGQVRRTESQIDAIWDKLLYTTAMRSQLMGGGKGSPSLEIVRAEDGRVRRFPSDEDALLEPGDVIEVRIHLDINVNEARN